MESMSGWYKTEKDDKGDESISAAELVRRIWEKLLRLYCAWTHRAVAAFHGDKEWGMVTKWIVARTEKARLLEQKDIDHMVSTLEASSQWWI